MDHFVFWLLCFCICIENAYAQVYVSVGNTVTGVEPSENCGASVALSGDGQTLVVGCPMYAPATYTPNAGRVRIFSFSGTDWSPWAVISSSVTNGFTGISVAISYSGDVVAFGAPGMAGIGRIATYGCTFESGGFCGAFGGAGMTGTQSGENFGSVVALSSDGLVIAGLGPNYDDTTNSISNVGIIRVYYYSGGSWVSKGEIYSSTMSYTGVNFYQSSLALNNNGSVLVVGQGGRSVSDIPDGRVLVYSYQGSSWTTLQSIPGSSGERFGTSVGVSSDGKTVVMGGPEYDSTPSDVGRVQSWSVTSTSLSQRGSSILGTSANEKCGSAVAISSDGKRLAYSCPGYSSSTGRVYTYSYSSGSWMNLNMTLSGQTSSSYGTSLSMSADGKTIAVGALMSTTTGAVYVYQDRSPTSMPTYVPSMMPTPMPSVAPSAVPSVDPSIAPSYRPSSQPSSQPSRQPSSQPSRQPTRQPTSQPSRQPTCRPSRQPSGTPSSQPSGQPSRQPSLQPTRQPTGQPSRQPSQQPQSRPSSQPTIQPTSRPSSQPSRQPSLQPSIQPSRQPSRQPSSQPTSQPSMQPSRQPTMQPSRQPSSRPSRQPTSQPTRSPTTQPSNQPSTRPSAQPTSQPSRQPTSQPSMQPTVQPSAQPSRQPSRQPSVQPSVQPYSRPTTQPSGQPSMQPSLQPTVQPSSQPSRQPSGQPSSQPTCQPSQQPSNRPSRQPTMQPSRQPSSRPSRQPTLQPTWSPTTQPSNQPSTRPSAQPTSQPSRQPTSQPSMQPTVQPSAQPSRQPSRQPSAQPSVQPSGRPTAQPSRQPTAQPSLQPTVQPSSQPSRQPSGQPSSQPTCQPSRQPSNRPSRQPSGQPSGQPSVQPSQQPSRQPTQQPSGQPSAQPSGHPSRQPTQQPSSQPSRQPTSGPTSQPSCQPSMQPTSQPSVRPSWAPSSQPSSQPTSAPSAQPLQRPTSQPSSQPSGRPTQIPTQQPSSLPSSRPSGRPSAQPTDQPSRQPTRQPSGQPSGKPSSQPSRQPSGQPSNRPSGQPTSQPFGRPSSQPSNCPTAQPSQQPVSTPTGGPSSQPSAAPSMVPSGGPSSQPSSAPSVYPSNRPTSRPSSQPSVRPSMQPWSRPSGRPSSQPSTAPSGLPSVHPTNQPSSQPSTTPSSQPSTTPTSQPTCQPSRQPLARPSRQPTSRPSSQPTVQPSRYPFASPTSQPTSQPSGQPTWRPSSQPSHHPSCQPSARPSGYPTGQPASDPSCRPSSQPSSSPSRQSVAVPSSCPSTQPSVHPSRQPSTQPSTQPSSQPSANPTSQPSRQPSQQPSRQPTSQPSTALSGLNALQNWNRSAPVWQYLEALSTVLQSASSSLASLLTNTSVLSRTLTFANGDTQVSLTVASLLALPLVRNNQTGNVSRVLHVSIPSSANSVSVDVSSSSSNSVLGVLLSVIQLAPSWFPSGIRNVTATSNRTGSMSTGYRLSSDVVTIQLSTVSANQSSSIVKLPSFETTLHLTDAAYYQAERTRLNVNCTIGVPSTASLYCRQSKVWMNLTCTGAAAATVRRDCPVAQTVCTVVNLQSNAAVSSDYCRATTVGSSVICRCGYSSSSNTTSSMLALNGRVTVAAFSSFVSSDLDATVSVVGLGSGGAVAQQSVLVLVTFGGLWMGAVLSVLALQGPSMQWLSWRSFLAKKSATAPLSPQAMATQPAMVSAVVGSHALEPRRSALFEYVCSVIPAVLAPRANWYYRWGETVLTTHLYFRTFAVALRSGGVWFVGERWSYLDRFSRQRVVLDTGLILTSLTVSCFVLAIFYDLQSPSDDGFCELQRTREACLYRKTLFDPTVDKCRWVGERKVTAATTAALVTESLSGRVVSQSTIQPDAASISSIILCRMNENNSSVLSFLLSFVIASIVSNIVSYVLDHIFRILEQEDADEEESRHGAPNRGPLLARFGSGSFMGLRKRFSFSAVSPRPAVAPPRPVRRHHAVTLTHESAPFHVQVHHVPGLTAGQKELVSVLSDLLVLPSMEAARSRWIESLTRLVDGVGGGTEMASEGTALAQLLLADMLIALVEPADRPGMTTGTPLPSAAQTVYMRTLSRWFVSRSRARRYHRLVYVEWLRWLLVGLLLCIHGGSLYFLMSKAAVRGYAWQIAFFQAIFVEWASDIFVCQMVESLILDCWLPSRVLQQSMHRNMRSLLMASRWLTDREYRSGNQTVSGTSKFDVVRDGEMVHATDIHYHPAASAVRWIAPSLAQTNADGSLPETLLIQCVRRWMVDHAGEDRSQETMMDEAPPLWWLRWVVWVSPPVLESAVSLLTTFFVAFVLYVWFSFAAPVLSGRQGSLAEQAVTWLCLLIPLVVGVGYVGRDFHRTVRGTHDDEAVLGGLDAEPEPLHPAVMTSSLLSNLKREDDRPILDEGSPSLQSMVSSEELKSLSLSLSSEVASSISFALLSPKSSESSSSASSASLDISFSEESLSSHSPSVSPAFEVEESVTSSSLSSWSSFPSASVSLALLSDNDAGPSADTLSTKSYEPIASSHSDSSENSNSSGSVNDTTSSLVDPDTELH